jgi:hypothetical protein
VSLHLFEDFLSVDSRFGQDPTTPALPSTPEGKAASEASQAIKDLAWYEEAEVDFRAGQGKAGGYVKITVKTPNPLQILEDTASEIMKIAGMNGVSVQIQGLDTESDLTFVFSRGVVPPQ